MERIRKRSAPPAARQEAPVSSSSTSRLAVPSGDHGGAETPTSAHRRRSTSILTKSPPHVRKMLRDSQTVILSVFCLGTFATYMIASHAWLSSVISNTGEGSASSTHRILHQNIPQHLEFSSHRISAEYLPQRPRVVGVYFENASSHDYFGSEAIDPNTVRLHKTRTVIQVSKEALEAQEDLLDSDDYRSGKVDDFEVGDCVAQYEWQKKTFPTCNALFETDWTDLGTTIPTAKSRKGKEHAESAVRLIANGYWRDVWRVPSTDLPSKSSASDGGGSGSEEESDSGNPWVVLKSMRYEHDYEPRNYDRHRRDAVAMERLTSSSWVMDIYAFCGNSGLFEFADGGSLDDSIFYGSDDEEDWTPKEKLIVAFQVAAGIASMHNFAKEGVPAMAHTDITTSQFVYVSEAGIYKLNDFNRCRFIRWNKKHNTTCDYTVGNNPGSFRSPEEYAYHPQSEKVDVYSMGNIFYALLTGKWPFEHLPKSRKARDLVKKGIRPSFDASILNTTNPFERALYNVTKACWVQDPVKRISSRQAEQYIAAKLKIFGVDKLE